MKLDDLELKQELFELFTDYPEMNFDEINKEVDQPRVSPDSLSHRLRDSSRKSWTKSATKKRFATKQSTI